MESLKLFLSDHIYVDYLFRLLASLLCGFCLGFERKLKQHTVGLRTLILICTSSAMLSILSTFMADAGLITGDPTRICAAVVTGIGFLGAGAIVNQGLNIRGLTSAAVIFAASALGVTCGAGLYVPAGIVLAIIIITLFVIGRIEHILFPAERRKLLKIAFSDKDIDEPAVRKILTDFGIIIHDQDFSYDIETNTLILTYTIKVPDMLDSVKLSKVLSGTEKVANISLNKY